MRTRSLIGFLAIAMALTSCSTSLKFGGSSGDYDDVYYNADTKIDVGNSVEKQDVRKTVLGEESSMYELDNQAQQLLESNEMVDTVIYQSDSIVNPYEEILVDNYRDSYERRLRGYSNPWYGVSNGSYVTFSDNMWYASAYDPAFYNIVVMGDDIWVEPNYISASFGYRNVYPSTYYYSSWYNWGFGYNNWYYPHHHHLGFGFYNNYWSPYGGYYGGYYNGYYDGYHNGYWGNTYWGHNYYNNSSSYSSNRVYGKSNKNYSGTYSGKQGSYTGSSQSRSAVSGKSYTNTRSSNTRSSNAARVSNTNTVNSRVGTRSSYTRSQYGSPVTNRSNRSYTPVYTRPRSNSSYNAKRITNTSVPQRSNRSYNNSSTNSSNSSRSYNYSGTNTRSSSSSTNTRSSSSSSSSTTKSTNTRTKSKR